MHYFCENVNFYDNKTKKYYEKLISYDIDLEI